jgi:hypothetical protein
MKRETQASALFISDSSLLREVPPTWFAKSSSHRSHRLSPHLNTEASHINLERYASHRKLKPPSLRVPSPLGNLDVCIFVFYDFSHDFDILITNFDDLLMILILDRELCIIFADLPFLSVFHSHTPLPSNSFAGPLGHYSLLRGPLTELS